MPDPVFYADSQSGKLMLGADVPIGSLAFLSSYSHPVLVTSINQNRSVLYLSGEYFGRIWQDSGDMKALVVPEWRLEIDPRSMVDDGSLRTAKGCAFRNGSRSGIVGEYETRHFGGTRLPIDIKGSSEALDRNERTALFLRWRIVAIGVDSDHTLVEHEITPERF